MDITTNTAYIELRNQLLALNDPIVDEHLLSIANGTHNFADGVARMAIDLSLARKQLATASVVEKVESGVTEVL